MYKTDHVDETLIFFKWAACIFPCDRHFNPPISQEYSPFLNKSFLLLTYLSYVKQIVPVIVNKLFPWQAIHCLINRYFPSIPVLVGKLLYRLNICKPHLFQNNEKVRSKVKTLKNISKRTIKKREDHLRFWKFFRAPHQSDYLITKWSLPVMLLCIDFQQLLQFATATLICDKSFPNCNSV